MEYHDENTLFKVRWALQQNINVGSHTADDLINKMLNAGIVFRERMDEGSDDCAAEPDDCAAEPDAELREELPMISKDEYIRLEALTQSVICDPSLSNVVIDRADKFEQYIKNGKVI